MTLNRQELASVLDPLHGSIVRRVELSDGNVLAIGMVANEFQIWLKIYSAAWRLQQNGAVLAASLDSADLLSAAVEILDGKKLDRVEVCFPSLDSTFAFSGLQLRVFPVTSQEIPEAWQQWTLTTSRSERLTVGPGQTLSLRKLGKA